MLDHATTDPARARADVRAWAPRPERDVDVTVAVDRGIEPAAATAPAPPPTRTPHHGLLQRIADVGSYALGMAMQAGNEITQRLHLPFLDLPRGPIGDVFEPPGDAARSGARLVERAVHALLGVEEAPSPDDVRATRPLVAEATVDGRAGATTRLELDLRAPGVGAGVAGRPPALLAAYVDGRYHSTVVVHEERTTPVSIALGELAPGAHRVELRSAQDRAPLGAPAPAVHSITTVYGTGTQAEVDRHAPILELRDAAASAGPLAAATDDTPLAQFPSITHNADGTRTIEYVTVFSNEDGGTRTQDLVSQYGHALDVEPTYRVHLAADGAVLDEAYQTATHDWRAFDGRHDGERPVLRVSSRNNMTSARLAPDGAERWSEAPVQVPGVDAPDDHGVFGVEPWVRRVGEDELAREGKVSATPDRFQAWLPERTLEVGPLDPAARERIVAAGGMDVRLRDGRTVRATARPDFASGEYGWGGLLLPEGVTRDDV
ncbi:MAG: hypothetical protein JWM98_2859 [Thermoleophilia bacterium]|nr:hypothetical protein [Thermoleophilia bacterium]